jgi:hypothetical protein
MPWSDPVFLYCERAQTIGFWAEPANALSNLGFITAAFLALKAWRHTPRPAVFELILILLTAAIGLGSFAFHTMATRFAQLADVIPIVTFMLAYAAFALDRFCGFSRIWVSVNLLSFAIAMASGASLPCHSALRHLVVGAPCLNGSVGYVPALAMLAIVSIIARAKHHPAAGKLMTAALVFSLSLVARSLDWHLCEQSILLGQQRGSHAIWHLANAATLWLLLCAALNSAQIRNSGQNRSLPIAR